MITGTPITIETPDGRPEAYLARPNDDDVHPAVLLFMDAFGLRPQIEAMVDRIAGWGYVVLAPNLFYRDGSVADIAPKADLRLPGEREKFFPTVTPLITAHTPDRAARDFPAFLAHLLGHNAVRSGPIGVTGYCMGGRLALRAAAQRPDQVGALGMFHVGGLVTDDTDSAHRYIPNVTAEVLAGYADDDPSMTPAAIAAVDELLTASAIPHDTSIRPGAPHGYTMADTSSYDEAAAHWHDSALRALLDRTIG